jgi:hypothetical protein
MLFAFAAIDAAAGGGFSPLAFASEHLKPLFGGKYVQLRHLMMYTSRHLLTNFGSITKPKNPENKQNLCCISFMWRGDYVFQISDKMRHLGKTRAA